MNDPGGPACGLHIARTAIVLIGLCVLGAAHAHARPAELADPAQDQPGGSSEKATSSGVGPYDQAAPKPDDGISYGVALRARYISVPGWALGLFTTHNVPLSTFGHFGIEVFRRRGKTDLVGALSYQNMSPPDGNWFGVGHQASTDTNFVQFKGLAIYNADIAFLSRETFNE